MGFNLPSPDFVPVAKPDGPKPPVLADSPQGKKPKQKSMTPTVLGGGDAPSDGGNWGGKTLLGQ